MRRGRRVHDGHGAEPTGYGAPMQGRGEEGDPQSETVSAPHQDEAPPKRTARPVVFLTLAVLALLVLAALLVWAALDAA